MRSCSWTRLCRAATIALAATVLTPSAVHADTYLVDSTDDLPDASPADNVCATAPPAACTLRAAVMQANAHFGADTIDVPAGTYVLNQEIAIATPDHKQLTIEGIGDPVIIDVNGAVTFDRAFEVIDAPLDLSHVTIENGNTPGNGGAIYAHGGSTLSLHDVSLLDNSAGLGGGAVYATDIDGNIDIDTGVVQGNTSQGGGGGIAVVGSATVHPTVVLTNLEIAGNKAQGSIGFGGGVNTEYASVMISACSLHDNTASSIGGGLSYAFGPALQITDSTFDHNESTGSSGGGLDTSGGEVIVRSSFTNNSANQGGGINADFGTHTWTDVVISDNQGNFGAGASVNGAIEIVRGRIEANVANFEGGGLRAEGNSSHLTLTDSVVSGNHAPNGGGIWTTMPFTAMACAIYGNRATNGGGIFAAETSIVSLNDSVLDHNGAGTNGGGLYVDSMAQARLYSTTITGNGARQNYPSPGSGGGIYVSAPAAVTAFASVFAYNINSSLTAAPSDCSGTLTAAGYDFVGSSSGCTIVMAGTGNQIGTVSKIDPQLSAFQRLYDPAALSPPHASPKFGRVPLTGSPLINAGPPVNFPLLGCTDADGNSLEWDEIGQWRLLGGRCDIGAVEYGAGLDEIFSGTFDG